MLNNFKYSLMLSSMLVLVSCTLNESSVGERISGSIDVQSNKLAPLVKANEDKIVPNSYFVILHKKNNRVVQSNHTPLLTKNSIAKEFEISEKEITSIYNKVLYGFRVITSKEEIDRLRRNKSVKYIEAELVAGVHGRQIIDYNLASWGLDRIDQRSQGVDDNNRLASDGIYTYSSFMPNVNVYVIDSGIRISHSDFEGRASNGMNFVNDGSGYIDCNGHGTHVAGTIAGKIHGVSKSASIVNVRVADCDGNSTGGKIVDAFEWIGNNAIYPAVVNISLGTKSGVSLSMNAAAEALISQNISVITSAGNKNIDACAVSPSSALNVITVGNTDSQDERNSDSNFGTCVDLFAPGTDIRSAGKNDDSNTTVKTGTSMASPHVAGVAAHYAALGMTASDVFSRIIQTSTNGVLKNIGSGSPNKLLYAQCQTGMGSKFTHKPFVAGDGAVVLKHPVLVGNFSGSDYDDIAFTLEGWDGPGLNIRTKQSDGNGGWTHIPAVLGDGAGVLKHPVLVGNFSGSDYDDIAFIGQDWDGLGLNIRIKESQGDGTWIHRPSVTGDGAGVHARPAIVGDFNGDNYDDILFLGEDWFCKGLSFRVHYSNGDGTWLTFSQAMLDGSGVLSHPAMRGNFSGSNNTDISFVGQGWDDPGLNIRIKESN